MANPLDLIGGLISGYRTFTNNATADKANEAAISAMENAASKLAGLVPPDLQALLAPLQKALFLGVITPADYQRAVTQGQITVDPYTQSMYLGEITPEDYQRAVDQGKVTIGPYEKAVQQGVLTPEDITITLQGASKLKDINVDPQLLQDQSDVLTKLRDITDQGGLTAIDRARLSDIASETATKARGARGAAQQDAAARGVGGGGLEMLRRSLADQGAATDASKRGLGVAADAEARALQALAQRGNLASGMRSQDFNEQATTAKAEDAIAQFNTSMENQASTANTNARNKAASEALAAKYGVQTQNLQQSNLQNAAQQKADADQIAQKYGVQSQNLQQGNLENQARMQAAQTALAQKYGVQSQNLQQSNLQNQARTAAQDKNITNAQTIQAQNLNQSNLENQARMAAQQTAQAQAYAVQNKNIEQGNLDQALKINTAQNQFNNTLNVGKAQAATAGDMATLQRGMATEAQRRSDAFGAAAGTSLSDYFKDGVASTGVGGALNSAGTAIGKGITGAAKGIGDWFKGSGTGSLDNMTPVDYASEFGGAGPYEGDLSNLTPVDWASEFGGAGDYGTPTDYLAGLDLGDWQDFGSVADSGDWLSGLGDLGDWFSDKNLKKSIKKLSDDDLDEIFMKLSGNSFEMKDPKHGAGKHVGIMAQDLLGTPGEVILKHKPEGLAVDGKKAQELALAALAGVTHRVKKLEGKK